MRACPKIPFENVVRNLGLGKYRDKIMQADYSNLSVRLFKENKFADNLGVSKQFLYNIGLIKITKQAGWYLPREPTVNELLAFKTKIELEFLRINQRKLCDVVACSSQPTEVKP